jgi:CheY-like chemotaxis protein
VAQCVRHAATRADDGPEEVVRKLKAAVKRRKFDSDARWLYYRPAMSASVLIVDDDDMTLALVAEVLTDEGFTVTHLGTTTLDAIRAAVKRLEPDVVLLDGGDKLGYSDSWANAAWLHERPRPVAVVMFTSHAKDLAEGQLRETERSQRAAFVGIVGKPFELDTLLAQVKRAATNHARSSASPMNLAKRAGNTCPPST